MPFNRPNLPEIIARVESDIASRTGGSEYPQPGSVAAVFAAALGGASHLLHAHLDWGIRQMLPTTASGEQLDEHARIWLRVPRKAAAYAEGSITLTGSGYVPEDTLFARADGVRYAATVAVSLNGSGQIPVRALDAGSGGNAFSGSLTMMTPILGIDPQAAIGGDGISGGAEAESDDDLRRRLIKRIQGSAQGGADYDYETWALEVPGVTRAWVLPLHYGLGTVAVAVVNDNGSNGIIPDAALLARVSAHIEQVRPVTARVSVIAPKERKVRYRLRITPDTAAARAAVEAALRDYHLREANLGGVLHLSRISEAISLAAGEFSHAIQEPAADIVCTSTEIATYGGVTWPD